VCTTVAVGEDYDTREGLHAARTRDANWKRVKNRGGNKFKIGEAYSATCSPVS
jgi:hypothetical protein